MLTIAVSSRALFRMEKSHEIFLTNGPDAFEQYQRENERVTLEPGVAFPLVCKFLALNTPEDPKRVKVVLLSRNSPDAGLRVMRSISHYKLDIESALFTQGVDRFRFAQALKTDLFLSVNSDDVRVALENGVAAAAMLPHGECAVDEGAPSGTINVAFDGDSVLFSDVAERVYQEHGLAHFQQTEQEQAEIPLPDGPFRALLMKLAELQRSFPKGECPLKTALVTARGIPAQERVLKTLRSWGINVDTAIFCGGMPKGPFLEAFKADIHFDDTMKHCENAVASRIPAGHVPSGIANEKRAPSLQTA